MAIVGKIKTITLPSGLQYELGGSASTEIVAEEYDPTDNYSVGDYCSYEDKVYRAIASTTGTFDSSDWLEVTVMNEIVARCSILPANGVSF